MPIAQAAAPVPNRGGRHVAFRQKITTQTVGDLAGIDAIIFLLRQCDGAQHHGMRYFYLRGMGMQMIVDPTGEDRRLHGDGPRLRQSLHPPVQIIASRSDLSFPVDLTAGILYAIADCLLVNIQCDVIHNVLLRSLPGLFSESAFPLSSALYTPRAPLT